MDEERESIVLVVEGKRIDEQFTIIDQIGRGSYGAVYKATHNMSGTLVALKKLEVFENLDEITSEIEFMKKVNGPFIVKFFGNSLEGSVMWIAMEYCGLGSVRDIIVALDRPLKEEEIRVICRYVLRALEYLHSNGKIHRDIKTDNILVNANGQPKLADFGVSSEVNSLQKRRTMIGTPFFLAPEVIMNEDGYDHRCDVWSLGITAIEMADMVPPHHQVDPMRVLFLIPSCEPPTVEHPENWSSLFNKFVGDCLKKDPNERPTSKELLQHEWILQDANKEEEVMKHLAEEVLSVIESSNNNPSDSTPLTLASPREEKMTSQMTSSKEALPLGEQEQLNKIADERKQLEDLNLEGNLKESAEKQPKDKKKQKKKEERKKKRSSSERSKLYRKNSSVRHLEKLSKKSSKFKLDETTWKQKLFEEAKATNMDTSKLDDSNIRDLHNSCTSLLLESEYALKAVEIELDKAYAIGNSVGLVVVARIVRRIKQLLEKQVAESSEGAVPVEDIQMFLLEQTLESVEIADSNALKKMTSLRKAIALVIADVQKLMFEYKELLKSYTEESSYSMETAAILHNIHDVVKKVSHQLKPFSEITTEAKSSKDRWQEMNKLKEQTQGKIKSLTDRVATLIASVPFHDSVNEVLYIAQLVRAIKRLLAAPKAEDKYFEFPNINPPPPTTSAACLSPVSSQAVKEKLTGLRNVITEIFSEIESGLLALKSELDEQSSSSLKETVRIIRRVRIVEKLLAQIPLHSKYLQKQNSNSSLPISNQKNLQPSAPTSTDTSTTNSATTEASQELTNVQRAAVAVVETILKKISSYKSQLKDTSLAETIWIAQVAHNAKKVLTSDLKTINLQQLLIKPPQLCSSPTVHTPETLQKLATLSELAATTFKEIETSLDELKTELLTSTQADKCVSTQSVLEAVTKVLLISQ